MHLPRAIRRADRRAIRPVTRTSRRPRSPAPTATRWRPTSRAASPAGRPRARSPWRLSAPSPCASPTSPDRPPSCSPRSSITACSRASRAPASFRPRSRCSPRSRRWSNNEAPAAGRSGSPARHVELTERVVGAARRGAGGAGMVVVHYAVALTMDVLALAIKTGGWDDTGRARRSRRSGHGSEACG